MKVKKLLKSYNNRFPIIVVIPDTEVRKLYYNSELVIKSYAKYRIISWGLIESNWYNLHSNSSAYLQIVIEEAKDGK